MDIPNESQCLDCHSPRHCFECAEPYHVSKGACCPEATFYDGSKCRDCPVGASSCNHKKVFGCKAGYKVKKGECIEDET